MCGFLSIQSKAKICSHNNSLLLGDHTNLIIDTLTQNKLGLLIYCSKECFAIENELMAEGTASSK